MPKIKMHDAKPGDVVRIPEIWGHGETAKILSISPTKEEGLVSDLEYMDVSFDFYSTRGARSPRVVIKRIDTIYPGVTEVELVEPQ